MRANKFQSDTKSNTVQSILRVYNRLLVCYRDPCRSSPSVHGIESTSSLARQTERKPKNQELPTVLLVWLRLRGCFFFLHQAFPPPPPPFPSHILPLKLSSWRSPRFSHCACLSVRCFSIVVSLFFPFVHPRAPRIGYIRHYVLPETRGLRSKVQEFPAGPVISPWGRLSGSAAIGNENTWVLIGLSCRVPKYLLLGIVRST